jgi:hypothetical protein
MIFGEQNDNRPAFSLNTSVFPASIIPPMLHTHSLHANQMTALLNNMHFLT